MENRIFESSRVAVGVVFKTISCHLQDGPKSPFFYMELVRPYHWPKINGFHPGDAEELADDELPLGTKLLGREFFQGLRLGVGKCNDDSTSTGWQPLFLVGVVSDSMKCSLCCKQPLFVMHDVESCSRNHISALELQPSFMLRRSPAGTGRN